MARKYTRDSRGRFSGGGGGGKATGGSLGARSSAKRSAAKLAGKDAADTSLSGTLSRRAQKAAVTRTGKASKAAQTANRAQLASRATPSGAIRKTDVIKARVSNAISKNIESRNKAGLNPPTAAKENQAARVKRATDRVDARGGNAAKPAAQVAARKVDLSKAAFERRAQATEKRAKAAEREVAGADRGYASPSTRRLFRRADALRSAADSYKSYVRRASVDFTPGQLFKGETSKRRRTTAPKLSPAEKARRTRAAKADAKFWENVRKMERARR